MLEMERLPQYQWSAATPFPEWITDNSALFCGKKVLEIGSGTGVVGLVVLAYAQLVVLTDCSLVSLAMMTLTMSEGSFKNCSLGLLRWGSESAVDELKEVLGVGVFDVVIGSDVFFFILIQPQGWIKDSETGFEVYKAFVCRIFFLCKYGLL